MKFDQNLYKNKNRNKICLKEKKVFLRLQIENNKTAQEVRNIIKESCSEFKALEDWE